MDKSATKSPTDSRVLSDVLGDDCAWCVEPSYAIHGPKPDGPLTSKSTSEIVAHALSEPIEFPPIDQAVIPGDRVVLAVDSAVPTLAETVAAIVEHFASIDLDGIDVVLSEEASDDLMMDLAHRLGTGTVGKRASVSRHDSAKRDSLMYLLADADGEPVYLNRRIVEADFVLPVQPQYSLQRQCEDGSHEEASPDVSVGLFPTFADSASQSRHCHRKSTNAKMRADFNRDLGMTLGVQVMLQVQVGGDGTVVNAACGSHADLSRLLADRADLEPLEPTEFVIACLDGDAQQQTWFNLARAASAVLDHVDAATTVVLWTSIDHDPPTAFARVLSSRDNDADALESLGGDENDSLPLNEDGFPDAGIGADAADSLVRLRESCRVLIRADIDAESIEELGLGVVHDVDQLKRLIASTSSCGLVRAAQFFGFRSLDAPR